MLSVYTAGYTEVGYSAPHIYYRIAEIYYESFDFVEFAKAIEVLNEHVQKHKEDLNNVLNNELDTYMEHQYNKLEMLKFLKQ